MRQGWPDSELAIAAAYLRMPHSLAAFASALHSCLQRMALCVHSYYEKRRVLWASSKEQRAGAALARTGCNGAIGLPWAQSMARCALAVLLHS